MEYCPFRRGESREEFQIRCKKGLKKLLGSLEQEEREVPPTAAAIVHGGQHYGAVKRLLRRRLF
jgi:hypothetical protein